MITPAPAGQQPRISPAAWEGDREQCPKFVGFPTRSSLPLVLVWSGKNTAPAIGARVHIYMNSYGPATVRGYFHADGYMGVICEPDKLPEWFKQQNPGVTLGHFFGIELEPRNVPQQSLSVCLAREKADRKNYEAQKRQARQMYPKASQKALRESYCAPALQILQWAIENTAAAQKAEDEAAAAQAAAATGSSAGSDQPGDWIPEYPELANEAAE